MNDRFRKYAAYSIIISSILFVILTTIAMFVYPGSYSIFDTPIDVDHYIFELNFFSDLGMTITETGESNFLSAILFGVALTLEGVCFFIYAITLPSYFEKRTIQRVFALISSGITAISAIGFIGVAFTPWNLALGPHILFVFIAFPVSLGYSVLFCIPIFMKSTYPNVFGYLLIGFSVSMGVYLWFLFGGPSLSGTQGLMIAALAQKVIVYIMILVIPLQGLGSLIAMKNEKNQ